MRKAIACPCPSAITQALVPYPPREQPSAPRCSGWTADPHCGGASRLLVGPHAGAVDEDHARRHAALLHAGQEAVSDAQPCPADKDLGGPPPRSGESFWGW